MNSIGNILVVDNSKVSFKDDISS
ncbi:hypothetical protein CP061683_0468A, partial [Chlamydia psittaci 06-1683]